jgi:hypothetical protein
VGREKFQRIRIEVRDRNSFPYQDIDLALKSQTGR